MKRLCRHYTTSAPAKRCRQHSCGCGSPHPNRFALTRYSGSTSPRGGGGLRGRVGVDSGLGSKCLVIRGILRLQQFARPDSKIFSLRACALGSGVGATRQAVGRARDFSPSIVCSFEFENFSRLRSLLLRFSSFGGHAGASASARGASAFALRASAFALRASAFALRASADRSEDRSAWHARLRGCAASAWQAGGFPLGHVQGLGHDSDFPLPIVCSFDFEIFFVSALPRGAQGARAARCGTGSVLSARDRHRGTSVSCPRACPRMRVRTGGAGRSLGLRADRPGPPDAGRLRLAPTRCSFSRRIIYSPIPIAMRILFRYTYGLNRVPRRIGQIQQERTGLLMILGEVVGGSRNRGFWSAPALPCGFATHLARQWRLKLCHSVVILSPTPCCIGNDITVRCRLTLAHLHTA
jgi:hypothetical protein